MRKQRLNRYMIILLLFAVGTVIYLLNLKKDTKVSPPETFGIGRPANLDKIRVLDIDVMPDGRGLPEGSGNIESGKLIYNSKCVACHGNGEKTENPPLGERLFINIPVEKENTHTGKIKNTLIAKNERKPKTIGTYWPYATTIFDYVRRAMPYNAPGSLTDAEVYHLTAYLLYQNKIIAADAPINAKTLPKIVMPNRENYVEDDRVGGTELK